MALDITHKVKALNWFHSIDLGDGLVTQGVKSLETLKSEQQTIFDPILLSGASVLDVGAWNGAHSFETARRGAKVLATDHFVWVHEGWRGREGFDIANIALDLNVEARLLDVPDITVQNVGKHDVVLFLGVLYHLPAPLPLLQSVASVATDCMIVETHADFMNLQEPVLRFHPGDSLNGDASNYFSPNLSFVVQALREVGFTTFDSHFEHSRLTVHAWRSVSRRRLGSAPECHFAELQAAPRRIDKIKSALRMIGSRRAEAD